MKKLTLTITILLLFSLAYSQNDKGDKREDWLAIMEAKWGPGYPTDEKLAVFDEVWREIDLYYPAFINLSINWNSIRDHYRPEIENGVSHGRFISILNNMAWALCDNHVFFIDENIFAPFWGPDLPFPQPGDPLFYVGGTGNNSHFGASLTLLEDSSTVVYDVLPDHPLNLEPGDIILGYDGVLWKNQYKELLELLPFFCESRLSYPIGSSEASRFHLEMTCAGKNWHLFDVIDIIKYSSGDTIHLQTGLLSNPPWGPTSLIGSEQLDIPGVPKPAYYNDQHVSYGTISNTKIGYVYVWTWDYWESSYSFYEAISELMIYPDLEGLIIDCRYNLGGSPSAANNGYSLLFNKDFESVGYAIRYDDNHYHLMPNWHTVSFTSDPCTFFNKPIAVLTGPGAYSAGDMNAQKLIYHPMARFFGKPTQGAFGYPYTQNLGYPELWMVTVWSNSYFLNNPGEYLYHIGNPVDDEVWLTRDGIAQGSDDVVEMAKDWIESYPQGNNYCSMGQGFYGNYGGYYCNGQSTYELMTDLLACDMVIGGNTNTLTMSITNPYCPYCSAAGIPDLSSIYRVILGDINNYSGFDGYEDNTDLGTRLNTNGNYNITIENWYPYPPYSLGIWIDWNQDEVFDDFDEKVLCEVDIVDDYGTYSFIVPADALPGTTRMRIRISSVEECGPPCGEFGYGEVEDYSVSIDQPFTGPPKVDVVDCLIGRLPGGGPSTPLNGNAYCEDPVGIKIHKNTGRFKNSLLSQTITLGLNLRLDYNLGDIELEGSTMITAASEDCADPYNPPIPGTNESFNIHHNVIDYLGINNTINDLFNLANLALAGEEIQGVSLGQISESVEAINEAFDECRVLIGFGERNALGKNDNLSPASNLEIKLNPNPCSGTTQIQFKINDQQLTILDLYQVSGIRIKRFLNEVMLPGEYEMEVDLSEVPAGVYFCTLPTDDSVETVKVIKY